MVLLWTPLTKKEVNLCGRHHNEHTIKVRFLQQLQGITLALCAKLQMFVLTDVMY